PRPDPQCQEGQAKGHCPVGHDDTVASPAESADGPLELCGFLEFGEPTACADVRLQSRGFVVVEPRLHLANEFHSRVPEACGSDREWAQNNSLSCSTDSKGPFFTSRTRVLSSRIS